MFDKLEDILFRYDEVLKELSEPEVLNDAARYQKLMKEQSDLEPIVEKYKEYTEKNIRIRCIRLFCLLRGHRLQKQTTSKISNGDM